jgi:hypothetical protein
MFSYFLGQCRIARVGIFDLLSGLAWLFFFVTFIPAGIVFAIMLRNWPMLFTALGFGWICWMARDGFIRCWPSQIWERAKNTRDWHEQQLAEGRRIMQMHEEESMHPHRRW